jgi:hypothetical protein
MHACTAQYFLHRHEKVTALPLCEAVAGVLLPQLLHLGALLPRACGGVELPHHSPKEAIGRPKQRVARALADLEPPHACYSVAVLASSLLKKDGKRLRGFILAN